MTPSSSTHCLPILVVAGAILLVTGCGSDRAPASAAPPAGARYLAAADLERDLGNGFRAALYRLAVISQPPDDAADLGQDLPTGSLRSVRCTAAAERPAPGAGRRFACLVRWSTVGGASRLTRYAVRDLPTGCFAAGARPALAPHRDTTIASFSEHPLNTLVSARKGC